MLVIVFFLLTGAVLCMCIKEWTTASQAFIYYMTLFPPPSPNKQLYDSKEQRRGGAKLLWVKDPRAENLYLAVKTMTDFSIRDTDDLMMEE